MTIYPTENCYEACVIYCMENGITDYVTFCSGYCKQPLFWNEIFPTVDDFISKVVSIGSDALEIGDLYYLLVNKYAWSETRYMDEVAFILALKRELQITWPSYLKRKDLMDQIYILQIADLQMQIQTIRDSSTTSSGSNLNNLVTANNSPVVNADTVAINNKSNAQNSNKSSNTVEISENYQQLANKLESLLRQYDVVNTDYLQEIYRKVDPLFRVIL